jgi:hypothetical protein
VHRQGQLTILLAMVEKPRTAPILINNWVLIIRDYTD